MCSHALPIVIYGFLVLGPTFVMWMLEEFPQFSRKSVRSSPLCSHGFFRVSPGVELPFFSGRFLDCSTIRSISSTFSVLCAVFRTGLFDCLVEGLFFFANGRGDSSPAGLLSPFQPIHLLSTIGGSLSNDSSPPFKAAPPPSLEKDPSPPPSLVHTPRRPGVTQAPRPPFSTSS